MPRQTPDHDSFAMTLCRCVRHGIWTAIEVAAELEKRDAEIAAEAARAERRAILDELSASVRRRSLVSDVLVDLIAFAGARP